MRLRRSSVSLIVSTTVETAPIKESLKDFGFARDRRTAFFAVFRAAVFFLAAAFTDFLADFLAAFFTDFLTDFLALALAADFRAAGLALLRREAAFALRLAFLARAGAVLRDALRAAAFLDVFRTDFDFFRTDLAMIVPPTHLSVPQYL